MLSTSKTVLFPGHNHLLTTAGARAIIKVKGYQHQWLAGAYDLENRHLEVNSMVASWWIVSLLHSDAINQCMQLSSIQ